MMLKVVEVHEGRVMGIERAGKPGDERTEAERQELGAHDVDARHLGRGLVLVDRIHGAAQARSLEPREEQDQHDGQADDVFERVGIEGDVAEARAPPMYSQLSAITWMISAKPSVSSSR